MFLSIREPLTEAPPGSPASRVLEGRHAVFSASFLANPMLAHMELNDWPTAEQLRLLETRIHSGVRRSSASYVQVAFRGADEGAPPIRFELLGYDVIDGTDSFLLDYGDLPVESTLNEYGLLASEPDAKELADAILTAWRMEPRGVQVWSLYRMRTSGPVT